MSNANSSGPHVPPPPQPKAVSHAKEYKPINAGLLARMITLLMVKTATQKYVQRLWKPWTGLLFAFKFCIKVKPFEDLAEAHAIQLVAKHTSIPVPKIYCSFIHGGATYIVMSKIDGQMASQGWTKRSEESKGCIIAQLRSMVAELRKITPPEGVGVANVDGGPIFDCRLPSKMFWGPFATVRDFHQELTGGVDLTAHFENLPPGLDELLAFYREQDGKLVLTHGDLSSLNIMVQGDKVVGIIDWETAGWFPPYWEYTCAWNVNPYNTFWQQEVDKFLTPMPHELRMEAIRRRYFGAF